MRKIIAANWKMNHSFDECDEWLDAFFQGYAQNINQFQDRDIIVCPPHILLDYIDSELMEDSMKHLDALMQKQNKTLEDFSEEELNGIILGSRPIKLGAQDCHDKQSGSYTGAISADMLSKVGCEYVIVGHSERREGCFEKSELISRKIACALESKLTPIICVGESRDVREKREHLAFIETQIEETLASNSGFGKLVIAYEPIWAIGSGLVPTNEEIAEVANLVKNLFEQKYNDIAKEHYLLYGGSVKESNATSIMEIDNVDGLLVGGASLKAQEFLNICLS
ncbi:MAG: triose-phosphate isomerase [Rickettsiales bacterium]|nr:triose-phosphate isomerase [Rickettsiales bacterium]